MELLRLFIVWLLVLLAYVIINPPVGKARIVETQGLSKPAKINKEYVVKHESQNKLNKSHTIIDNSLVK